jgi:hypothetical protein
MKRRTTAIAFVLALASGLSAQSLSIPPSTVKRGASGTLLLILESPPGKAPVALQWEVTFPPGVAADLADIAAGSAAELAQKTIACRAAETKNARLGIHYRCLLAGGQKTIANGPVAVIRYRVPLETKQITEAVRVGMALAVTPDLKSVDLEAVRGVITVK